MNRPPAAVRPFQNTRPRSLRAVKLGNFFIALWIVMAGALMPVTGATPARRPKLQIINGSRQPIDIFWLKSDTERVPNGSVAPGKDTVMTTTLGHRFDVVGRDDKTTATVKCEVPVQGFRFDPSGRNGVPAFYTQTVSANGFPIVASAKVNPYALKEAAFLVDMMLAKRPDVRAAMIQSGARMCIMAHDEFTTDLPEFARMAGGKVDGFPGIPAKDYWDARARGLGGSETDPLCSVAEENVLCFPGDHYSTECILIHEFAHNIHLRGLLNVDPTFDSRLKATYAAAMKAGLWKGKYASVNHYEYFAEGVQSWFDNNRVNDHDHNHVHLRSQLIEYDPGLAAMCREVFGDTELKYTKPTTRLTGHMAGYDPAKVPTFVWPARLAAAKKQIKEAAEARDKMANGATGPIEREVREVSGWKVKINKSLLDSKRAETDHALVLLEKMLDEIIRVVPKAAVVELQKVPLYFSPPYAGKRGGAEFHPDAGWLRNNGRDPIMAKGVEFSGVADFEQEMNRMPNFALHELAHAYHNRFLKDGFDNAEIKAAYEHAKASGKYGRIERWHGNGKANTFERAYAMSNPMEYFAENSEAFFSRNDFFPFTREELKKHDPEMFALVAKLWGAEAKPDDSKHQGSPAAGGDGSEALVRKPNILLILADDLGYGDLRCYNDQSKVATPHLDRLAREGMRFTDAHSPATVCTPTRYSLLTGQMAFRVPNGGTVFTGVGGPSLIAPGRLTLPAILRGNGYETACVGKWHVGLTFFDKEGQPVRGNSVEAVQRVDFSRRIEGGPLDHGFDRFFGTACCPTTDWLYAFIENDRVPVAPVGPLDKSQLPKHAYANDCRPGLIAPDFPMEEVDLVFLKKSREFLEQHVRKTPGEPFFLFHSAQAVHLPSFAAPQFKGKTQAGPHGDFIHQLDFVVGELLATLEALGVADNTLVIFTSDNGPETTSVVHMRTDHAHDGARPWRGMKRDSWEGGHRVPFLVRWPGKVKPATTSAQLTSLTDVMATIAAITGTKLPENAAEDSFNMFPALLDHAAAPIRPYLLTQAFSGVRTLSIRRGPWKYLDHPGSGGNRYENSPELKPFYLADSAAAALYNLDTDPGETRNLLIERPDIVKELQAMLEESKASGRSSPKF